MRHFSNWTFGNYFSKSAPISDKSDRYREVVQLDGRCNLLRTVAVHMEHELETPDEELTPDDRLSQVASLLAAAILRMRPPTPSICENPAAPSKSGLELVSESLLTVTRGELESQRSHKRQKQTRRIQK